MGTGEVTHDDRFAARIAAARAGDLAALGDLFEGVRPYLLSIASRAIPDQLRSKGGGSDLVQETFLEAQRDFGRFRGGRPEELKAWLRGLLRNNVVDWSRRFLATERRSIGRERHVDLRWDAAIPDRSHTPSRAAAAREEDLAVEAAIERLPPEERLAVLWRNREHRSFEEIGARLGGRSGDAARKLWARAILRLQRSMEPGRR